MLLEERQKFLTECSFSDQLVSLDVRIQIQLYVHWFLRFDLDEHNLELKMNELICTYWPLISLKLLCIKRYFVEIFK